MISYIALLIVALVGTASAVSGGQLESLCKGNPVKLDYLPDILPFIDAAKGGQSSACSDGARQSILDLEPIVKSENVCSIETSRRIALYYEKYVSRKGEYYWRLPKQVKGFFLAVGFMANSQCELSLERGLRVATKERISEEDDRVMRDFNRRANHLAEIIMKHDAKLQSLFIVTDLDGSTESGSQGAASRDTISVNPKTKVILDEIKRKCRNKFKPVYDKLIIPLVIMENIGFDYDEGHIGGWKDDFRKSPLYEDWFKVVFICESALRQKIIVNPKTKVDREGNEQKVTVLDENDLAALREETGLSFDEPEPSETPEEFVLNEKPSDRIDLKSYAMREMIDSFRSKHTMAKNARQSLMKKFLSEAEQIIYIDQVRFGRIKITNSNGEEIDDTNVTKKKHWISRALGLLGEAIGVAIAYPLTKALLAAGYVTYVIIMTAVDLLPQ